MRDNCGATADADLGNAMNQDVRAPYYAELGRMSFSPGWARPAPSLWPSPRPLFKPAVWRFAAAKASLDQAAEFVPVEQAERRNLIMVNPIEGNGYATTRNIVAAYQMVKAGETAKSHRHSPAALRLVVEAKPGTYTIVNGARVDMLPGDVVLTPSWSWHGHVNETDATSYWIDFLDVPIVHLIEPMFLDHWDGLQPIEKASRDSDFVFPLERSLAQLARTAPDDFGRHRVQLGEKDMPSLGLYMNKLAPGAWSRPLRSTENQVFAVVSGSGESRVGDKLFKWTRGDVVVGVFMPPPCRASGPSAATPCAAGRRPPRSASAPSGTAPCRRTRA